MCHLYPYKNVKTSMEIFYINVDKVWYCNASLIAESGDRVEIKYRSGIPILIFINY